MAVSEMPYSLDLRERVIASVREGMTQTLASEVYKITRKTIYTWLKLEEAQGHLEPATGFQKGHSHGVKDLDGFRKFVDLHPDYTQEEMAKNFSVGSSTISRTLEKIGYSRKKRAKPIQKEVKKNDKSIWKK
jgi:transposase